MDKLIFGLFVTALGMATVFVALLGLIYILEFMNKIVKSVTKEKKTFPTNKENETIIKSEEQNEQFIKAQNETEDQGEILAVIVAAISAYLNESQESVVIKSYRRIDSNVPLWNRTGRQEQTTSRL